MNIFYVDRDPRKAAKYLADKHVVKMIVESCQMLATAHHLCGSTATYKPTHKNHPSTIWVRQRDSHYIWLWHHAHHLCLEYSQRYGKTHKCEQYLLGELFNLPKNIIKSPLFDDPPQCMPDQYKKSDTVEAYRTFYIENKVKLKKLNWKKINNTPDWVNLEL